MNITRCFRGGDGAEWTSNSECPDGVEDFDTLGDEGDGVRWGVWSREKASVEHEKALYRIRYRALDVSRTGFEPALPP